MMLGDSLLNFRFRRILKEFLVIIISIFAILCSFKIINSFIFFYSPLTYEYLENKVIRLFLISSQIDDTIFFFLTILIIALVIFNYFYKRLSLEKSIIITMCSVVFLFLLRNIKLSNNILIILGFIGLIYFLLFPPNFLNISRKSFMIKFFIAVCGILIIIELLSIFSLILLISNHNLIDKGITGRFIDFENQLSHILSFAIPYLLTFTIFIGIFKIIRILVRYRAGDELKRIFSRILNVGSIDVESYDGMGIKRIRFDLAILALSIALGCFIALYPFILSDFRLEEYSWGDIPAYVHLYHGLDSMSLLDSVSYIFFRYQDRAFSILPLLFALKLTGVSPSILVKLAPLFYIPFIVVSAFFFVKQVTGRMSLYLAVTLTALSCQVVIGMGLGLLSNLFALIFIYLYSGLFMITLRKKTVPYWVASVFVLAILSFAHSYSWLMLNGVLAFFSVMLMFRWVRERSVSGSLRVSSSILGSSALLGLLKALFYGPVLSSNGPVEVLQGGLALENIFSYWKTIGGVIFIGFGPFDIQSIFMASFCASILLFFRDDAYSDYLLSWFGASSIFLLLGDRTIIFRVLYNIPVQLFAAESLLFFNLLKNGRDPKVRLLEVLFVLLLITINTNYALHFGFEMSKRL